MYVSIYSSIPVQLTQVISLQQEERLEALELAQKEERRAVMAERRQQQRDKIDGV
jgi:hypothetical protein